jgi:hypothetical protein
MPNSMMACDASKALILAKASAPAPEENNMPITASTQSTEYLSMSSCRCILQSLLKRDWANALKQINNNRLKNLKISG